MLIHKVFHIFVLVGLLLAACGNASPVTSSDGLQVVASTNIVGDVVARVGGDLIDLTVLFPVGTDPHTFNPSPQDIITITEGDVVFIHGLHLEETLDSTLDANVNGVLVHVADGVEVLEFAAQEHEGEDHEGEDEHAHEGGDPHTWTNPNNVIIWVENIASSLSGVDPLNAAAYQANAEAYIDELRELDSWIRTQVESIPVENRELVTDHATFGYFAEEYGFEQVGLVIPAASTNAEPSAKELTALIDAIEEHGVPAIFVGTTVNTALAEQVAEETGVQIVKVYTGSLSEPGGEAENYLEFMRYNVSVIVEALR
jgi:ABC-type Zn uptake system ZnuABC Zn-binding protein ZnuA